MRSHVEVKLHMPALRLIIHPTSEKNTLIPGIYGVDLEHAGPEEDDWFLSDFYAFNYLLKGMGATQTWLAAADPRELLGKYGPFVHGSSPVQERKVILSEELIGRGEITMPRVVEKGGMVETVFKELRELVGDAGDMDGAEVLVLVFGHYQQVDKSVVVEYSPGPYPGRVSHLVLAESWSWGQLQFAKIRDAVDGFDDIGVSLLTTACHSGGWELRRLVDGLRAEDGVVGNSGSTKLSFEDMCIRQIIEVTERKVVKVLRVHTFSFVGTDVFDVEFGRRWGSLSEAEIAAAFFPLEEYEDRKNLGGLFGGTYSTQLNFVKRQARSHFDTCQHTWNGGETMMRSKTMKRVARDVSPTRDQVQFALDDIKLRVAIIDLADLIVRMLDLPRPDGQLCQEWNRGSPTITKNEEVWERKRKIDSQL